MKVERDVLITAAVIVALVLVAGLALWMPSARERARLDAEIAGATAVLAKNVKLEADLYEQRAYVNELKSELATERRYVPRGANLGDLLRRVSNEVRAQAVTNHETQTLPIIRGQRYHAMPVVLTFSGSFPASYELVESIETMPRLVRVTALNIDGDPTKPNAPLHVRIEMAAFFTPEGGAP